MFKKAKADRLEIAVVLVCVLSFVMAAVSIYASLSAP
jgi:hypothetical protein